MKTNHIRQVCGARGRIELAMLAAAIVVVLLAITATRAEPNEGSSESAQINLKRHYLIAPRIGRSSSGAERASGAFVWPSADDAAPTFWAANRNADAALRQSPLALMLLMGNRRVIGARSSGLLPQARIGRRAAPMGLMPQPRVGRRSSGDNNNNDDDGGQQEVAVATLTDTSPYADALETIYEG